MRRTNQRRDAVFACYQQQVTDRPLSVLLADAKPFTIELAQGVETHREELDEVIAEFAQGWDLNRIAPLEKNIMRVALYEMNFRDDVPFEVAIDEAVETAKKFCGAEAPGFVNGILGAAAREMKVDGEAGHTGTLPAEEIKEAPAPAEEIRETPAPAEEISKTPTPAEEIKGNPAPNGEAA